MSGGRYQSGLGEPGVEVWHLGQAEHWPDLLGCGGRGRSSWGACLVGLGGAGLSGSLLGDVGGGAPQSWLVVQGWDLLLSAVVAGPWWMALWGP